MLTFYQWAALSKSTLSVNGTKTRLIKHTAPTPQDVSIVIIQQWDWFRKPNFSPEGWCVRVTISQSQLLLPLTLTEACRCTVTVRASSHAGGTASVWYECSLFLINCFHILSLRLLLLVLHVVQALTGHEFCFTQIQTLEKTWDVVHDYLLFVWKWHWCRLLSPQ